MIDFKHPWQVTASLLIKHALEHSKKDTDFDTQMAYLLTDVGVEIALKTYLSHNYYKEYSKLKNEANKKFTNVTFHKLIKLVIEVAGNKLDKIRIDEADYFHSKRNQIYHDGDGVAPTRVNLDGYLNLAQSLLLNLLDVNCDEVKEHDLKDSVSGKTIKTLSEVYDVLSVYLDYFHRSCSLIAEQMNQKLTTHLCSMKLRSLRESHKGDTDGDAFDKQRGNEKVQLFNKITGLRFDYTKIEDVDFLVLDPNHLYVWLVLKKYSDDFFSDWDTYDLLLQAISKGIEDWKQYINGPENEDDMYWVFEKTSLWLCKFIDITDKYIQEAFPDIKRLHHKEQSISSFVDEFIR